MIKPVYALVGDDSFLQLQKLDEIAGQLPADAQRVELEGDRAELADVLDELRSFTLFGGGKLVVLRDADEFLMRYREPLEQYVAAPASSATLVLRLASLPKSQRIYKAISKVGQVEECNAPGPHALPGWIAARARVRHKIALSPAAAALLADLIGSDLGRLDSELAKLALSAEAGKVDVSDISSSVAFQRQQAMQELTTHLAGGEITRALHCWRRLVQLDPSSEFRAVTWLTMWLEDVREALAAMRQGRRPDSIRNAWRYKGDRMPAFVRTIEKLGENGAAHAIDLLAEFDRRSKSGLGEAADNVERFILALELR